MGHQNQTSDRNGQDEPAIKGTQAPKEIVAPVEAGSRKPENRFYSALITLLCLSWSGYQLYIAYEPLNSHIARAWHLAFAICLAFLAYPAYHPYRPPFWVKGFKKTAPWFFKKSILSHIPFYDILFALLATSAALYIWWDYNNLVFRQGMPSVADIWMGTILIVLLLEAARRTLGPALAILALLFLMYNFIGPHLPEILRHRGVPHDFVISDMYLSTTGIFGVPLGVSTDFVFLFVLFGALLDKAGGNTKKFRAFGVGVGAVAQHGVYFLHCSGADQSDATADMDADHRSAGAHAAAAASFSGHRPRSSSPGHRWHDHGLNLRRRSHYSRVPVRTCPAQRRVRFLNPDGTDSQCYRGHAAYGHARRASVRDSFCEDDFSLLVVAALVRCLPLLSDTFVDRFLYKLPKQP